MKFLLVALMFLSFSTTLSAQELIKEYFDRDNKPVEKEAAYFYRVGRRDKLIRQVDTVDIYVDTVKSFYVANNRLRSREVYNYDGELNGTYSWFHENGVVKERGQFFKGERVGIISNYYPNGKVKMISRYTVKRDSTKTSHPFKYELLSYNDSTGKQIIVDGNGYCTCVIEENEHVEKGWIRNGLRDSVWQAMKNDTLIFEELYDKGKFIQGKRFDQGEVVTYDNFEISPTYPSGFEALYQWIAKTITYPKEARRKGIQGTVFIGFIVERDGVTSNHNVVKGVHPWIDEEALRVVSRMDKWTPGIQRGRKVRVKYVLPLQFKLGY